VPQQQRLIAVIDDDESFCTALTGLLRSLGYRTRGFPSADAFLSSDAIGSCDCIISDIHLPGLSGIDLKERLAAMESPVPMIMVTGRNEPGLQNQASKSGAICLLRKPLRTKALIDCLKEALDT
jgi:FixJ family two-component response regulator